MKWSLISAYWDILPVSNCFLVTIGGRVRGCLRSFENTGCIQLPIEKAERIDPNHLAFSYYLEGRKEEDGRKANYEARLGYYLLALSTLEKYDSDASRQGPGKSDHWSFRRAYNSSPLS
jgi:hypothetical protein